MHFTVRNLSQAVDATLAYSFPRYKYVEGGVTYLGITSIHSDVRPNYFEKHSGLNVILHGTSKGFIPIPFGTHADNEYDTIFDSLFAQSFTESELCPLTHVIITRVFRNEDETIETKQVDIYRLNDEDKFFIFNKKF